MNCVKQGKKGASQMWVALIQFSTKRLRTEKFTVSA